MNETVAKIVELLFQDVEMNSEVKAIHDEVMDNCQERYVDLLGRGLTEDEAVAAVVESLKGMEEVLAGYPRRRTAEEAYTRAQSAVLGGGGQASFSAKGLRRLAVSLHCADIAIEPSPDDEVHVVCQVGDSDEHRELIATELVGGELRVTEKDRDNGESFGKRVHISGDFLKDFNFEGLGEMIGKLMRGFHVSVDGDERVRVQVPASVRLANVKVQTASGNVGIDNVAMDRLEIGSQSGDLRVELSDALRTGWVEMRTTSGDMEAWLHADQVVLQSMSGDIRYVGGACELSANATSGDVNVEMKDGVCERCEIRSVSGDVACRGAVRQAKAGSTSGDVDLDTASESVTFSTISGDVTLRLQGDWLRGITGHTTSGDVQIILPTGMREADTDIRTTSGDVRLGVNSVSGAPLRIGLKTISGDVTIR